MNAAKQVIPPLAQDNPIFSIVIATYNGANRVPDVLDALHNQENVELEKIEVLVVDNASSDNISEVIRKRASDLRTPYQLRYLHEERQGPHFARLEGIRKARATWVGLLDDDNIPEKTWISAALQFVGTDSLGAFGGRIECKYFGDTPPAGGIAENLLVANDQSFVATYLPSSPIVPPTAGLVVNRKVWLDSVPEILPLNGRTGNSLLAGEDTIAVKLIQAKGWRIMHNPQMRLRHLIPRGRTETRYLGALGEAGGQARVITRLFMLREKSVLITLLLLLGAFAKDSIKFGRYLISEKRSDERELENSAHRGLLKGSVFGPIILLRQKTFWKLLRCSKGLQ